MLGGRFVAALASLTLVSFLINFVRRLNRMLGPGTLVNLLLGRCVFLVTERIQEQTDRYLARYGVAPEFKAGIHGEPS